MKVFIPFNSNDFNSIFTTLSISPISFYSKRKYSFKRASATLLNSNESYLVGYKRPVFHSKEYDIDFGYPVLLEIDVDFIDGWLNGKNDEIQYLLIPNTVYLTGDFRLYFRREKEMLETFAKSLKSIETKYVGIAKIRSSVMKEDVVASEIPSIEFPSEDRRANEILFARERRLNKIWGVIVGSSVSCLISVSKEWQEISNLLRHLNNNLSLYLNKIGDSNDLEKRVCLDLISKISSVFESIEKLDETIMLESNISSDLLGVLKSSRIFNIPVYHLIIEGLLMADMTTLPVPLLQEKLVRAINARFNSKYPAAYIETVNEAFFKLRLKIEDRLYEARKQNTFSKESIITFDFSTDRISLEIPDVVAGKEREYLRQTLIYFVNIDGLTDIEFFFINRKDILVNLANHYKSQIPEFAKSPERDYLLELLKSFDSLRSTFEIGEINNDVLKVIAVLFTSGRDFQRFLENNEKNSIINPIIYYSIWGSIYGAAIFPKTTTDILAESETSSRILLSIFDQTTESFKALSDSNFSTSENIKTRTFTNAEIPENVVKRKSDRKTAKWSEKAQLILDFVSKHGKVRLANLKTISPEFKNISNVESVITGELSDQISIKLEGRSKVAVVNSGHNLFN